MSEALHDARQKLIDTAEEWLFQRIEEGDTTALIFFLKTQGRSRGYGRVGRDGQGVGLPQEVMDVLKKAANR